jgi:serine/threonine protein kinase
VRAPAAVPMAVPVAPSSRAVPLATAAQAPAPESPTPAGLIGQTLAHFQIGALLAQGHSGSVFHARDARTGQEVALKVLWPHLATNADVVQRLRRSSTIMLSIRHPNIVALYEAGQTGAYYWLAMEYIDGESLTQVIDRIGVAGMLDWRYAFRVAVHIGRALDTIHQQHIIHRNLAPQNVLLRASDKTAVLSDVVLAKALEGAQVQQITQPGEILGDVRYMAPEQVTAAAPVDARADLYCLGAMLYALLTGRPPLIGGSLPETVTLIRNVEPARPRKFQMSIGDLFEGVVMKLLAKQPQARFQTAYELLHELERVGRFQGIQV